MSTIAAGHDDRWLGQSCGLTAFDGFFNRAMVNIGPEHTDHANLPRLVVLASSAESRANPEKDIALCFLGPLVVAFDRVGESLRAWLPLSRVILSADQYVLDSLKIDLAFLLAVLRPRFDGTKQNVVTAGRENGLKELGCGAGLGAGRSGGWWM
jgi:hypothetical protein